MKKVYLKDLPIDEVIRRLKAMREGKYASLNGRDFRIEDFGVDGLEILEENVLDEENDFWYWSLATLEAYDIMSEDREIV